MATVDSIMSRTLLTVGLETPTAEAVATALDRHVRHLLVCDAGAVAGVACLCDLEGADKAAPISEVMSAPVAEIAPTMQLNDAAKLMRELGVGCFPVSIDGFPVGFVTRGDLRRAGYWSPKASANECDDECDALYFDTGGGD